MTLLRLSTLITIAFLLCSCAHLRGAAKPDEPRQPRKNKEAEITAYVGGAWLVPDPDGGSPDYVEKTLYAAQGIFTDTPKGPVTRTVNLSGLYLVPPLAEGHNHWIEGPWTDDDAQLLLENGIIYYKNPSSPVTSTNRYRATYDRADTIDVSFSLAALSVSGSHPEPLYRRLSGLYGLNPDALDGEAFYNIPDLNTLEQRWNTILAAKPDFIKLIFLDILRESESAPDTLSVDVARDVVRRAHQAGLRVSVHGVTAGDFRTAVDIYADEIVHLPGWDWAFGLGEASYRITARDAQKAAQRGVSVVTTATLASSPDERWRDETYQPSAVQRLQADNLRTLRQADVSLSIGVDSSFAPITEIDYLRWLGFSDDAALLMDWIRTGPDHIFPDRAIGELKPGYEASFIALPCDPFSNFDCIRNPSLVEKQGQLIGDNR